MGGVVTSLNMATEAALRAERALTQDGARSARHGDGPRVKMAAPTACPGRASART